MQKWMNGDVLYYWDDHEVHHAKIVGNLFSGLLRLLSPCVHEDNLPSMDRVISNPTASSSLTNGDPTAQRYVQHQHHQQSLQHHLQRAPRPLLPPLVSVPACTSLSSAAVLPPTPLIPIAEPHSLACSTFTGPSCSYAESSSVRSPPSGAVVVGHRQQQSVQCEGQAPAPLGTVPLVSPAPTRCCQPALTYPAGASCLRPLSPMSPPCISLPLSAPPLPREPVGQLRHFGCVPRLQLGHAACTCPMCAIGENSNKKKKKHMCHYPNCSKVYARTGHLHDHIREHTGERPFICHWLCCGKRFNRYFLLQRHLRIHTGERRFVCAECDKRFMRSDHLNNHIKSHQKLQEREAGIADDTGERRFVCAECDKRFKQKAHLNRHIKSHQKLREREVSIVDDFAHRV